MGPEVGSNNSQTKKHLVVFEAGHLGLDNLPWGSSLEKTDSPLSAAINTLEVFIYGVRLPPSIHAGMSTGVINVQVFFKQPYSWDFIGHL